MNTIEMKVIEEFKGEYEITSDGRVGSNKKQIFLSPATDKDGYKRVCLYDPDTKKKKMRRVHRLVAEAFIPNPDNLPLINHKDECVDNNDGTNLEGCTKLYNNNYGTRNERLSNSKKKGIYCKELDKVFHGREEAAAALNAHITSITNCCKGHTKTCKGYHLSYVEEEEVC